MIAVWLVLGLVVLAVILYVWEPVGLEVTSAGILAALLVLGQTPLLPGLGVDETLAGLGNPALITVLALLVVGEALVGTGALGGLARGALRLGRRRPGATLAAALAVVALLSGVLNNTPVVVIFIPLFQALAAARDLPPGRVMLPLSLAAILGGMTTLIGSSTNLLAASAMAGAGLTAPGFFDLLLPGGILAALGLVYVILVAPRLLPERGPLPTEAAAPFVAQLHVGDRARLIGRPVSGRDLGEALLLRIRRDGAVLRPPFTDVCFQEGDRLVVAADRRVLTELLARDPGLRAGRPDLAPEGGGEEIHLAEVMVAPVSVWVGQTLGRLDFRARTNCVVLGIRRRAHLIRTRLSRIRLEPGDILLVQGTEADLAALGEVRDLVVMAGSQVPLVAPGRAGRALTIFALLVSALAAGLAPVVVAVVAAVAMVVVGVIHPRRAVRVLDARLILLVAASLALGRAMEISGAAAWVAHQGVLLFAEFGPLAVLSAFFALVAVMTNLLSNNATAVLFVPIGIALAQEIGVDPMPFAFAVIFAANCAFATPMGYQTHLLVMGPGHYRFGDYVRVGAPLLVLIWAAFTALAPWVYGL